MLEDRGAVVWANRDAAELLGYEESELKDLALPCVGDAGGDASVLGPVAVAFNQILMGETKAAEGEARFPMKSGMRVAVHWKLWRMPQAAGGNVLLAISDAGQHSSNGPELAGYRDTFEHAVEGIFRSTLDGRYLEVNAALARMYGFASPAELISVLKDIPHQLYVKPERREELIAALLKDGSVNGFEAELNRADGTKIWCAAFARTVFDSAGKPSYLEGSVIDITERKKTEDALRKSESQLRELADRNQQVREEERMNVAREIHDELGQALTLLRLDLSWLGGRLNSSMAEDLRAPLMEKIGAMEQMIHWTLRTVRRILSALRPPLLDESGLKEAVEFHLQEFSKRVAIRYELTASPIHCLPRKEATAVFRIFQEILTNIARHANASRVKVHLWEDEAVFTLKVQDNGCGIAQEKLVHTRNFGLMGMHERALAIGGSMEILSSPRTGTTIILTIPCLRETSDNPPSPTQNPSAL